MSRSTSATLRRAVSRAQTDRTFHVLLDIDHPDRLPDLADTTLRGAWLNSEVAKTPNDYSLALDHMLGVNDPTYPEEGAHFTAASSQYLRRVEADWNIGDSVGAVSALVTRDMINAFQAIFCSADEATNNFRLEIGIGSTAHGDALYVFIQENGIVTAWIRGSTSLAAGVRYHIVVVSIGTSYVFYVNGQPETLIVNGGADNGDWLADISNRDNVVIGVRRNFGPGSYFDGTVRDVRVYGRAPSSREVYSMSRAALFTPIRVVNNTRSVHKGGKAYLPFPFQINMPDEREDRTPGVQLRIDNVDQQIVEALRQLDVAPTVSLSVVMDSDPDTVEAGPFMFTLRRATYDANSVVGELEYEDVMREPIPGHTFTPSDFPGIFAGVS